MNHGYSQGTTLYLVIAWEYEILIATADGELVLWLSGSIPSNHDFNYSGDDSVGVCNVESI